MNGTHKAVGRGRSIHKEALGDFNQALTTWGWTGGLDSGLHREEMAPGKVKDLEGCRGTVEKSRLWAETFCPLAPFLPNPGTKHGLTGPPLCWAPLDPSTKGISGVPSTYRGPYDLSRRPGPALTQSFLGL